MRFSFLGVGNMGKPLAMNILKAGEQLSIYTRRKDCAAEFAAAGAKVVPDIVRLGVCDVLCTCLPLPQHLLDVMIEKEDLYSHMPEKSIHLEFSTIDPATAHVLMDAASRRNIAYVQATVSKTPQIAAEGKAPLFVGGEQQAVQRLMPVLQKIGKPSNVRTVDASCAIKLLSNLIGMSNIAILAEGMRIGQLAGMDSHELLDLLLDTGSASFQMKTRGPWIADGDFKARFSIDIAEKDLRLGCAMSRDWGYEPKMISQTLAYLREASKDGLGDEDVCALYKITR